MKIPKEYQVRNVRPVRGNKPVAKTEATGSVSSAADADLVTVLGIPEAEFTPHVREAVTGLLREVETLTRQLEDMKRRVEDLEDWADQDDLLPVLNRRAFVREMSRLQSFGKRYNLKASLLYLDLNKFKQINDAHGHAAGDQMLVAVAQALAANLRESDILGRLGGDEFAIVLANATIEDAQRKAGFLADAIRKTTIDWEGHTLSVGVAIGACALQEGREIEETLAEADRAMYEAKRAEKDDGA